MTPHSGHLILQIAVESEMASDIFCNDEVYIVYHGNEEDLGMLVVARPICVPLLFRVTDFGTAIAATAV